jgi:alpha-tubulin suppressor-like RCC1 family protein
MRSASALLLIAVLASVAHIAATPADSPHFVSVTVGADHVCALTDGGDVYCWGSNEFGQLGIGSADKTPHTKPERVIGNIRFTTIAAGLTHTCGLVRGGEVFCWGANDSAQLGDGTIKNNPLPIRVAGDLKFKAIGPGGTHTCAVAVDGVGYCWGGNWHGQLGVGNRDGDAAAPCCYRVPTPIRTDIRFTSVVAGGIDSCGVAIDGKAYCWGSPQEGRLGTGAADAANKSADKTVPIAVVGDVAFKNVIPRAFHTCGLSSTDGVFCWGGNIFEMESAVPRRIGPSTEFVTVSTGLIHDCALSRDGTAYCWGQNGNGQIGDGTTHGAAMPQRVATDRRFSAITAGGNVFVAQPGDVAMWGFTCALAKDGESISCWGDNRHGALGNGSTDRALTPTATQRIAP